MPKAYKPTEKIKQIFMGGKFTPPKFFPTYNEWLASRGSRILRSGGYTGALGSNSIYTVPVNKTLYINYLWLSSSTLTIAVGNANIILYIDATAYLLNLRTNTNYNTTNSMTASCFIKINAGETIKIGVESLSSVISNGGFGGFLVNNQEIPIL